MRVNDGAPKELSRFGEGPPRRYRPVFLRGVIVLCGSLLALGVFPITLWVFTDPSIDPGSSRGLILLGMGAGCLLGGLLLIVTGYRSATLLWQDRIGVVGPFRMKTMARADVAGFRASEQEYVPAVVLIAKTGNRKLTVAPYRADAAWATWFDGLPDLDAEDAARSEQALLASPALGATPHERRQTLAVHRRAAGIATAIAYALAGWAVVAPQPYMLVIALLTSAPLAAFVIVRWSKGVITLDKKRNDPRPDVSALIIAVPFALFLRLVLDWEFDNWRDTLTVYATAGAIGLLAGVMLPGTSTKKLGRWVVVALFCSFYGGTVPLLADGLFDTGPAERFSATVEDKRISSGKHTSYNVELTAWGGHDNRESYDVGRERFDRMRVGAAVCIYRHPSRFGVRWIMIDTCDDGDPTGKD